LAPGDRLFDQNIGDLQPAAGLQDARHLEQRGFLIRHQVEDAVGDDHVRPATGDGQRLAIPFAELDVVYPGFGAARRALASMAGVMSTPTTWPSVPTMRAAIRLSSPAPQPTSTTRSPGCAARRG
jgi:hypothetical protein